MDFSKTLNTIFETILHKKGKGVNGCMGKSEILSKMIILEKSTWVMEIAGDFWL
jgi:hypothetical protein